MTAGLRGLGGHPEPDGGLECDHGVAGNNLWVVQAIKPDSLTSRDVVVAVQQRERLGAS